MAQTSTTGDRKAALLLHALSASERKQVLERLKDSEREQLTRHLIELESLGIPADRAWLADIETAVADGSSGEVPLPEHVRIVWNLTGEQAAVALQGQAPATVRAILDAQPWPWKEALMQKLPVSRREQLQTVQPKTSGLAGEKFVDALIREFSCAVQARRQTEARELPERSILIKQRGFSLFSFSGWRFK